MLTSHQRLSGPKPWPLYFWDQAVAIVPAVANRRRCAEAVLTLSWTGSCRWWSWASPGWGRSHSGWRRSRVWPRLRSGAVDSLHWNNRPVKTPGSDDAISCHVVPILRLPHSFSHIGKLKEVIFPQELVCGHVTLRKKQEASLDWMRTAFTCHIDPNLSFGPAASSRAAGRWESSFCSSDWSDDSDGRSTTGRPPLRIQNPRFNPLIFLFNSWVCNNSSFLLKYPAWSRCRTWLCGPHSIYMWSSALGCTRSSGWSCRWLWSEVYTGAAYWSDLQ